MNALLTLGSIFLGSAIVAGVITLAAMWLTRNWE